MCTPCTIDRFACNDNALLPRYNSYFLDGRSSGVDAFAQKDFLQHVNFVHPPIALLDKVHKLMSTHWPLACFVVVFPKWTTQPWFKPVVDACDIVLQLPVTGNACFHKVHNFPCGPYAKHDSWVYLVGFRNLKVTNHANWLPFKPT